MDRITLDLTPAEALFVHEAVVSRAADANLRAAKLAGTPDQDVALLTAQILNRVASRIGTALYPPCRYFGEEVCDRIAVTDGLCDVHRPHVYAA